VRKSIITLSLFLAGTALHAQGLENFLAIRDTSVINDPDAAGLPTVTGIATNTSNEVIKSAFIHINLLDAQDVLVGNTIAMGQNISPGQAWRFKASIAQQGVMKYRIQ
jgi:hypothetical protein